MLNRPSWDPVRCIGVMLLTGLLDLACHYLALMETCHSSLWLSSARHVGTIPVLCLLPSVGIVEQTFSLTAFDPVYQCLALQSHRSHRYGLRSPSPARYRTSEHLISAVIMLWVVMSYMAIIPTMWSSLVLSVLFICLIIRLLDLICS